MRGLWLRGAALALLVSTPLGVLGGPGCLLNSFPELAVDPEKVTGEASCMCSMCWNQAFCFDPTRAEGEQVYDLPCVTPSHEAVPADRVVSWTADREGGFFCWLPFNGAQMSATGKECPGAEDARRSLENFDRCVDASSCAWKPGECEGEPTVPSCSGDTANARPSVCIDVPGYDDETGAPHGAGVSAVIEGLADQCTRYGSAEPPSDAPARYCYLNCVSGCDLTLANGECPGCEEAVSDPQNADGAFPVDFVPSPTTQITVLIKDADGDFQTAGSLPFSGRVHFDVPEACHGPGISSQCVAKLTRMVLDSIGTLVIDDEEVSNVRLLENASLTDTFSTALDEGAFAMSPPSSFGVTGDLASVGAHRYATLSPTTPISTSWDWVARVMFMSGTLVSEDGNLAIQIVGLGTFDSLPPAAVVEAAPLAECGQSHKLSASDSFDPDGSSDIASVHWTSEWNDGYVWQARGDKVTVRPPLGTHRFYAKVVDHSAVSSTAWVDVTAEDHSPPNVEAPDDHLEYACQPTSIALIPRVVEDTCDVDPATELRITAINGAPVDIPYTPAYKFRFGETVVRYRAVDDAGNEDIDFQTVTVERGASCCPAGSMVFNGTNGNNVLNASSAQPSCLVGLDGNDTLVGNNRMDTILGGRGIDGIEDKFTDLTWGAFLWGGVGKDSLRSVSPNSTLSGGPGDDALLYSGTFTVKLRGGAGKDSVISTTNQLTTFVLAAACEAVPGELWSASGPSRIETPIPLAAIAARGVSLQLFGSPTVVITPPLADAECE